MIKIEIIAARGSTPREVGAVCYVSHAELIGTIGGGQLEYIALERAREFSKNNENSFVEKFSLNPVLGQCCGGEVTLEFSKVDAIIERTLEIPQVTLFGLGSVGQALTKALQLLPIHFISADDRTGYSALSTRKALEKSENNSFFIITTHSHALDFALAEELLITKMPRYVGMIGSETKALRFRQYFLQKHKNDASLKNFACPMGEKISDKRPEIIASLVAAQIVKLAFGG